MFDRRTFLVKERIRALHITDRYDILDPASGATIGVAEERIPGWVKALRLLMRKVALPTTIVVCEREGGTPVLTLHRGWHFLVAKVRVTGADGRPIGTLKSKVFSIGGAFRVFDPDEREVAVVQGNLIGWNFEMKDMEGRRIGAVTKKWAGIGKELFTNADNYMISLEAERLPASVTALLLAAGLAIDLVFKERQR